MFRVLAVVLPGVTHMQMYNNGIHNCCCVLVVARKPMAQSECIGTSVHTPDAFVMLLKYFSVLKHLVTSNLISSSAPQAQKCSALISLRCGVLGCQYC